MASVSLAEPRRRQKWTLNPRGNLWANDESKFGQKLMEKMGWEKGRGLGANQDGMVDHITLRHKDNNKGVGFQGHDNNWLAHQDDFQNVLAALNVEHGEIGKKLNESEKRATLEEISKKSKRRVHYQKFVKGKDSSNYSSVDLGCILGTKKDQVKNESEPSSPGSKHQETSLEENKNFVQSGNYTDYFAKKMAELKARGKFTEVPTWTESKSCSKSLGLGAGKTVITDETIIDDIESTNPEEANLEHADLKKKKKMKKREREREEIEVEIEDKNREMKKHKKAKKDKSACNDITLNSEQENNIKPTEKKSGTGKRSSDNTVEVSGQVEEGKKKKKKKSKKVKELVEDIEKVVEVDSGCEYENSKSKKTKKGKNKKVKDEKEESKKIKKKCKQDHKKTKKTLSEENGNLDLEESKEVKTTKSASPEDELSNASKKIGFHGSNLLKIPGYGVQ